MSDVAARSSPGPLAKAPETARGSRAAGVAPGSACVHRQFAEQARRAPDRVALTVEGRDFTYGEIDARADRLARALRAMGVGPEVLVGLYAERSADLIVGILGILKAGGAYVPLDPAYPAERLALILEDARVPVLLTQRGMRDRLPEHSATALCLDDEDAPDALPTEEIADGGSRLNNVAYVIYTSGSTGRPKGVAVTHANVARLFARTRPWFGFGASDVWTLFHSFAFDFSVWEIWGALIYGGRLVIVPYWVSRSPEAFYGLLCDEGVTVLNQTPSAFRQLIHAEATLGPRADLALRTVIFGGEALELGALRPWFERHGDESPRLINMYGITETTVHVTYRPVTLDDLDAGPGASPIGGPIPDLRVYLLDPRMEPVPVGVVGELYVGGAGLARGYLDHPGLTAERFVPDPFSGMPGARLYRSGDLARRRPDGEVDYVGRADHQVKIRGFRIELGEIESALLRHPDVREAVVLAREGREGDRRLVAYLAPSGEAAPTSAELREWLGPKLPGYMIPSAFLAIRALPLTEHGKVDRAALLALDAGEAVGRAAYVAPRDEAEEKVAGAWAAVLGVERVGALDHFFDLGGHSLLATQVASRLRDAFGVEVPVRLLFDAPTVAGLAGRLREMHGTGLVAPPVRRAARDRPPPLSFAQESLWYLDQLGPRQATFNVSAALRVVGSLDLGALRRAFDEVVRRHEALRTAFASIDGRPVQVIAPSQPVPLEVVDLSGFPPEERRAEAERQAEEETRRPFDLATGPLFRASLFRLDEGDHAVLLTMHHIITDGWSFGVAAGELAALYGAFREGRPSPLPEPAIQYADYALWQREWLRGEAKERLLDYWRRHLDGVRPLELPTDRPRPPVRSARGDLRWFSLPRGLSDSLAELGRREGATPFMTLLAAFQLLLARSSEQETFAVGSPIANRNRAEVEGLVGYFINMLALRADLSGNPTFRELLGRVREAALGGYEHQDLPLELLVEALHPERDASRTPLFQAMFVLQNNQMPDVVPAGLTLEPFGGSGTGTAKFDLSLAMAETPEGLVGSLEYATDLFDGSTIDRMLGRFRGLLEAVVADPDRRASDLDLATADDSRALETWNATDVPIAADHTLHGLFEAQARRTPEAEAVVHDGRSLTYRELDRKADRLARRLRAIGVGHESRVGIAMGRSLDLAVALLGTLKAGAAYVPLDPAYPRARLDAMREDAGIGMLLTDRDGLGRGEGAGVEVVCVGDESDGRRWGTCRPFGPSRSRGLCDLHLGLDRRAEGRGGRASVGRQPRAGRGAAIRVEGEGPGAPVRVAELRYRGGGDVPGVGVGGVGGLPGRGDPAAGRVRAVGRRGGDHGPRPADGLLARLGRRAGRGRGAVAGGAPTRRGRRRGGAAGLVCDLAPGRGRPRPVDQYVRADRGDGGCHRLRAGPGRDLRDAANRSADRQCESPCARRSAPPAADRRPGRVVHRRRGGGPRLSRSARCHGRAVRARPVRYARRTALSDGRPGPMAGRRPARIPRPARRPDQGPWLSRRTERGRVDPPPDGRHPRGGRRGEGRGTRRLCGPAGGGCDRRGIPASSLEGPAPAASRPLGDRAPRRSADDPLGEGRPRGPAESGAIDG